MAVPSPGGANIATMVPKPSSRRAPSLPAAVLLVVTVVVGALLLGAEPAGAHGVGGVEPSNYETTVTGLEPATDSVEVTVRDVGDSIELRADADVEVIVLGYDDEPYLRFTADGVFENRNSPAVFLNRNRTTTESAPPEYDADAEPDWQRISSGHTATWHDHRAHWMGTNDPKAVRDDPGTRRVVIEGWKIPLLVDGEAVVVSGDVTWVPGPAVWPWLLFSLGLLVAAVALGRTRNWATVLVVGLVALVAVESAHIVGLWAGTTGTLLSKLGANVYSAVGVALGVYALVRLLHRSDPYDATPAALVAGIVLCVAGGLADVSTLTSSQLPTVLAAPIARFGVATSLGAGAGVATVAAMHLRRPGDASTRRAARLRGRTT